MIVAGTHSTFVMESIGGGVWFNRTERANFCRMVAKYLGSIVPLFAGCIAYVLRDMIANAISLADARANFWVVTTLGYFQDHPKKLVSTLRQFAEQSPIPFLLCNVPVYTGALFATSSIVQLVKHENVAGVNDSPADFERFKKLAATMKTIENHYIFQGKEHILEGSLLIGASGIISTFSHFTPGFFVEISQAAQNKNISLVDKPSLKSPDFLIK